MKMKLELVGPYKIHSVSGDNVFHCPAAQRAGVYVYSVPFEGSGYLASYVGETGTIFLKRIKEHTINTLGGHSRIYEPKELARGRKVLLWDGLWKSTRQGCFNEFIEQYCGLSPSIYKFIQQFYIFFIPLEADSRIRRRVESAIANHLYKQPSPVGGFMDSDIRYIKKLQKGETPIEIEIYGGQQIRGFPQRVVA